jgi:hypothetical protein
VTTVHLAADDRVAPRSNRLALLLVAGLAATVTLWDLAISGSLYDCAGAT